MLWTGWKNKMKPIQVETLSRARFETGWSWKVWGCELHLCLSLSVSCTVYLALRTLWQSTALFVAKTVASSLGLSRAGGPVPVSFWRGEWWWYSSCAGGLGCTESAAEPRMAARSPTPLQCFVQPTMLLITAVPVGLVEVFQFSLQVSCLLSV